MFKDRPQFKRLSLYWITLSFQGGLLNLAGLMFVGTYVSHVTGFATQAGLELEHGNYLLVLKLLSVPFFFLGGSIITGFFAERGPRYHPRYEMVFAILVVLTLICLFFGEQRGFRLACLLSLMCGIQNALFGVKSGLVIRTTHLTGPTTDLGLGIANLIFKRTFSEEEAAQERLFNKLRIASISAFILGSAFGGMLFNRLQFWGFLLPLAIYILFLWDSYRTRRQLRRTDF